MSLRLIKEFLLFLYPAILYSMIAICAGWRQLGAMYRCTALATWGVFVAGLLFAYTPHSISLLNALSFSVLSASYVALLTNLLLNIGHRYAPSRLSRNILFVLSVPLIVSTWFFVNIILGCALLGSCI